ncbi:hypothetical protein CC78DRAFT_573188 [Lojkania enalia]|uniref:PARP catalytic domain-containing protein n=1 Tax=Lojkania enalia TaxID=147567 RepID=A0A9P4TRC8_9PLEO|nr:hypothetical protein CC78DRAFT_573188 [Didymosphaeria enalia]
MSLRISIPGISRKSSRHKEDSGINVRVRPLKETLDESLMISTIELPNPGPPPRISPTHKLLKKCHVTRHPKTLHELVNSVCQATCAMILRRSTLSSGTNLLVTDPVVVDLLLTCVSSLDYGYSRGFTSIELLPNCPLAEGKIKGIVNSLPALSTFSLDKTFSTPTSSNTSTSTLSSTILSTSLQSNHRTLLTWLLKSPFAHLSSITPTSNTALSFPILKSMGVIPLLVTQQPPNKELLFKYHCKFRAPLAVFHGTHPSRLPLILSQGLRNMSGTRYQSNGRAMGKGIYLAEDATTSICYSYGADGWKNSQWAPQGGGNANVRVLLGCELAAQEKGLGTYVIPDEGRVIVRFVFVVPAGVAGEFGAAVGRELVGALEALRTMTGF